QAILVAVFFPAEDGIRVFHVTGVQTCALPISGLIGGPQAKVRRERLGELLKIGYTNGKQLHKRLMMFQITKEDFIEALKCVLQRSEERRVRKECRPRRWRSHEKEKILSGQERR